MMGRPHHMVLSNASSIDFNSAFHTQTIEGRLALWKT